MGHFRLLFAGTPAFAVPSLTALLAAGHEIAAVYTQPDRPAGRGRKLQPSPVKTAALAHGLPVFQPHTLRDPAIQQGFREAAADFLIVVAWGLILPAAVLTAPRRGCLNVHASLLPRWRGAAPIQRAILAGDTETGITLMQMDTGLDTGPMLLKTPCPIFPADTAGSLQDRLATLGANTLTDGLSRYASLVPTPQNNTLATLAPRIVREEARIQWESPADHILRQIRAFQPKPLAFTGPDALPLRIWQAEILPEKVSAPAGQIIQAGPKGLDVATGTDLLRVRILQLPGGKPLPVADILNARRDSFRPGRQLGETA